MSRALSSIFASGGEIASALSKLDERPSSVSTGKDCEET